MTVKILAVYEQGQLRLLEPVELRERQQVSITIDPITADDAIRAASGVLCQKSSSKIVDLGRAASGVLFRLHPRAQTCYNGGTAE
jgi:predicted DNA-binding antitoxin AbrB/MazE fold protein